MEFQLCEAQEAEQALWEAEGSIWVTHHKLTPISQPPKQRTRPREPGQYEADHFALIANNGLLLRWSEAWNNAGENRLAGFWSRSTVRAINCNLLGSEF